MCQNIPLCYRTDCYSLEPLSIWNQHAARAYLCVALCFPFDNREEDRARRHLSASLKRLAKTRPLFASRLRANEQGEAFLERNSSFDIPLEISKGANPRNDEDYEDMAQQGFPPARFIDAAYAMDGLLGYDRSPVVKVRAEFIKGGLILSVFLHHAVVDGSSLRIFLECFSRQTRNVTSDWSDLPSEQQLPLPTARDFKRPSIHGLTTLRGLMAKCPEYTVLPEYTGPTQPKYAKKGQAISDIDKVGKVFVFKNERLEELKELVQLYNDSREPPSSYTVLATLTWAHTLKARMGCEAYLPGREMRDVAALWNPVNLRTRVFQDVLREYFGNATTPTVTRVPTQEVLEACDNDQTLARIVPRVKAVFDSVDQHYVNRRLTMLLANPDPRLLGLSFDPRQPEVLSFNTWRYFGADAEWGIPGVPVAKPDAVRRGHGSWNLGTGLILPTKTEAHRQELFLSMSRRAMDNLCNDQGWMQWVDRVIG